MVLATKAAIDLVDRLDQYRSTYYPCGKFGYCIELSFSRFGSYQLFYRADGHTSIDITQTHRCTDRHG